MTIISEKIQGLHQQPLTSELWYECYQLLNCELVWPVVQKQNKCFETLDKFKQALKEISQDSELQSNKNQIEVSQVLIKNEIKVDQSVTSIDSSPCGQYFACAADQIVIIFDMIQQKQIAQSASIHTMAIIEVRYSWNGKMIVSCSRDHTIIIWNANKLEQIGKILEGHEDIVWACYFSPNDMHLISGSFDRTIRIWSCQTQEQEEQLEVDYKIYQVNYSPNGKQIMATGESKYIVIWDLQTKKQLLKIIGDDGYVYKVRYSVDGKLIISGDTNNCIRVWNAISGQQIGNYQIANGEYISSLGFHSDFQQIVSGGGDGSVRLWNFLTKKEVCILHTHGRQAETVSFSKDGKYVLSGCNDGTMCSIKIIK